MCAWEACALPLSYTRNLDRNISSFCATARTVLFTINGEKVIMPTEILKGKIATGLGKASDFTEIPWAQTAFCDVLGVDPYPGTVNIIVSSAEDLAAWSRVKATTGTVIKPPQPDWCNAFCYKALIAGKITAAIVLPDVAEYPAAQVELIAAVNVRESLSLSDGDPVAIEIYETEAS